MKIKCCICGERSVKMRYAKDKANMLIRFYDSVCDNQECIEEFDRAMDIGHKLYEETLLEQTDANVFFEEDFEQRWN